MPARLAAGRMAKPSPLQDLLATPPPAGAPPGSNALGRVGNPACGDVVTLHVRLHGQRIEAAGYDSFGSPYQKAVAHVVANLATGLDVATANRLAKADVLAVVPDLPERHHHLAQLALDALRRALAREAEPPSPVAGTTSAADDAILETLADRPMTTGEVAVACRSRGLVCASPLRALSRLRTQGLVAGEMAPDGTWRWWRAAPSQAGGA